jgi:Tol biopolymer transport system component
MKHLRTYVLFSLLIAIAWVVVACGADEPAPTPAPATATPTVVQAAATPTTPEATATPVPTEEATAVPVEATAPESPLAQPESPLEGVQPESPLSVGPALDINPAAWPAGKFLFHSTASGDFQIYSVVDGELNGPLAESIDRAVEPAWSPDGSQIAFAGYTDDPSSILIYIMDADGSNLRPLMEEQAGLNWRPVWSPNGEEILFVTNRNLNFDIMRVRVDGSELVNLTAESEANDLDPEWTHDGEQVIFVSDREVWERKLYIMNGDGSDVREIPGAICLCGYPRLSPDGSRIVYASKRSDVWKIALIDFEGNRDELATDHYGELWMADWVGDDQLIYSAMEIGTFGNDLYLIDLPTGEVTQLTDVPRTDESYPRWIP